MLAAQSRGPSKFRDWAVSRIDVDSRVSGSKVSTVTRTRGIGLKVERILGTQHLAVKDCFGCLNHHLLRCYSLDESIPDLDIICA